MRTHLLALLASAPLLFAATSATGFSINHTTNFDGLGALQTSDTVTVHVFIDSEGAGVATPLTNPGLNVAAVGVLFTSPNLVFTGADAGGAYAYLNYYYPPYNDPQYVTGTYNGSQSTYLLFTFAQPQTGTFSQPGDVYLISHQTPWQTWPGDRPAGFAQVNLNWLPLGALPDFTAQARATTNTWLGSIVLHVADITGGTAETRVLVDSSCCLIRTGDGVDHSAATTIDPPTIILLGESGPTPSATPSPSATPTPSATPSATPTATPTAMPTPSARPGSCVWLSPLTTIFTIAKGQSAANNSKVAHAIMGNVIDAQRLKTNATRISVCEGTQVDIFTFDSTGDPSNTISGSIGGGISCDPAGCTVSEIQGTVKYISRSADGTDTDRITIIPK